MTERPHQPATSIERLRGLIVSCQAPHGSPLRHPDVMAVMAAAAAAAGAVGIRAAGRADITAIRLAVELPIIGLTKIRRLGSDVIITSTPDDAVEVGEGGADIVAIDATDRHRPDGGSVERLISYIHDALSLPVVADVDSVAAAIAAEAAGADIVATTLSGYTGGAIPEAPDLDLVETLTLMLHVPVIAEGRYGTPDHVRAAFERGAYAVVVGTAITDTRAIASTFVQAASEAAPTRPPEA